MQHSSPFKFLDAYQKNDNDIFFGRMNEVESLYQKTFQSNLILVYGMSGTGKTSLVQCGLANKFDNSDWLGIFIRRKENISSSLCTELIAQDKYKSFEEDYSFVEMVKSLYLDHLRPIYLVFDQFEELFILGDENEQMTFFRIVQDILETHDLPCKILLVMREEYLAHLSNFEKVVPVLFDKRLRIEPMTRANAKDVIVQTAASERFNIDLSYPEVADDIIDKVTEGRGRVHLPYLQVILDKLFRLAQDRDGDAIVFDRDLMKEVGNIVDVLTDFLDEQLSVFEKEVAPLDNALRFLKVFVSEKGTKIPVYYDDLEELLPEIEEKQIVHYTDFFVDRRILRPLDNNQLEIAHDSLAARIFNIPIKGIPMPELPKSLFNKEQKRFAGYAAYDRELAPYYFGRYTETKDLFNKIVNDIDQRTTLVIGPSGVGKTSLVKAGLVPRIESLCDVKYLRCSKAFVHSDVFQPILNVEPQQNQPPAILKLVYGNSEIPRKDRRKVIIIDQFEEFFIWIKDAQQLSYLFLHLGFLLEARLNIDLVIVVRDEFFSYLQDLEVFIPGVLEEQVRLQHIDARTAVRIIKKMGRVINVEFADKEVIHQVIQNISGSDGRINLTYLQLYMRKLYEQIDLIKLEQEAVKNNKKK